MTHFTVIWPHREFSLLIQNEMEKKKKSELLA